MNKSESPTLRELREQNKRSREEVADDTEDGAESGVRKRGESGRVSSAVTEAESAGKAGEAGERVKGYRTREAPQKED